MSLCTVDVGDDCVPGVTEDATCSDGVRRRERCLSGWTVFDTLVIKHHPGRTGDTMMATLPSSTTTSCSITCAVEWKNVDANGGDNPAVGALLQID